jgi:hypothetical protein
MSTSPKGEYLFIDPYLLDLACITAYMYVLDKPPHQAVVTQEDGYPMVIAFGAKGWYQKKKNKEM